MVSGNLEKALADDVRITASYSPEDYGGQAGPLLLHHIYLVVSAAGHCR